MIVLPQPTGRLLVVSQPDHAAMSADLAAAWRRPEALGDETWRLFLEAVLHHDDGWLEEEKLPWLDADGRLCDFKNLPAARHVAVWRRSVELASRRAPLIGLLVAGHAGWLYRSGGATTPREPVELEFLADLEESSAALRQRLAADDRAKDVAKDVTGRAGGIEELRALLSFCDALSLLLLGAVSAVRETERLTFARHSATLDLEWTADGLKVSPWPFGAPTVSASVRARELAATTCFRDSAEAARTLSRTEPDASPPGSMRVIPGDNPLGESPIRL